MPEGSDEALVARYRLEAESLSAQADFLTLHSAPLSDPRYVTSGIAGEADGQAYVADARRSALDLLEQQNAAVGAADEWGSKGDSYNSVMAIMAVGLFFLGLSLVPEGSSRFVLLGLGLLISAASVGWTMLLLLG